MNAENIGPILSLTGVVAHAVVRTELRQPGSHRVPVLVIELHHVGPGDHVVHARHHYTEQTRRDAEAWAARLTQGTRVTIAAPFRGLHLSVPHADFAIASSTPDTEELTS